MKTESLKKVVKVMNFHSLLRVDKAKKKAKKDKDAEVVEEASTSI